jgi:hypothetical protein
MRTYKISSSHDVCFDSWENGEGEQVNYYTLNAEIKAENPVKALEEYFKNTLFYNFNYESGFVDEDQKSLFQWDVLVDVNNEEVEANDALYGEWKNGRTLYNNHICVTIQELIPTISWPTPTIQDKTQA